MTRNSSGDDIANVNYDDILQAHAKYNRLEHKCRHESARLCVGMQVYQSHAVQGHSRSPIFVPIKSSYDFLFCTVSKLWLIIGQIFASERRVLSLGVIPCQYRQNDISLKLNWAIVLSSSVQSVRLSFEPKATYVLTYLKFVRQYRIVYISMV